MSSLFKGGISVSIFGESHGKGIGVVLDDLPAGEEINPDKIGMYMARRAAKSDGTSTMRLEKDIPDILSGIYEGKTTGTPLAAGIFNGGQPSQDHRNPPPAPRWRRLYSTAISIPRTTATSRTLQDLPTLITRDFCATTALTTRAVEGTSPAD